MKLFSASLLFLYGIGFDLPKTCRGKPQAQPQPTVGGSLADMLGMHTTAAQSGTKNVGQNQNQGAAGKVQQQKPKNGNGNGKGKKNSNKKNQKQGQQNSGNQKNGNAKPLTKQQVIQQQQQLIQQQFQQLKKLTQQNQQNNQHQTHQQNQLQNQQQPPTAVQNQAGQSNAGQINVNPQVGQNPGQINVNPQDGQNLGQIPRQINVNPQVGQNPGQINVNPQVGQNLGQTPGQTPLNSAKNVVHSPVQQPTKKPKVDVDKCIAESEQNIISDYLKIAEGFSDLMESISQPIYQTMDDDKWMRNFMIKNMFKPCSDYIAQLKNFEHHYGIVESYVFRKFVDEINPNAFNPDSITAQVIDVSGWELQIERFSQIIKTKSDFGAKSKDQLKEIVVNLYGMFTKKYTAWYQAGMTDKKAMKQSVIIQLVECDGQYQNCLNLAGVLQINYNPREQRASMRLIGGVFRAEHVQSDSSPVYDLTSKMPEEEVQKLEFLFSYHRNLKKMRKDLHDEFSAVFDHEAGLKNFDNTDSDKNCKNLVIPKPIKTYSDCAPSPVRYYYERNWNKGNGKGNKQKQFIWYNPGTWGRKRRETNSDDNEDSIKCIFDGTCHNTTHSVQKRSYYKYADKNEQQFRGEFFTDVHRKISGYSDLMDSRDFERSACMLDKFESDKKKQIGIKIHTDIQFSKMEESFAKFLVMMFGKNCDDCITTILRANYEEFKKHIEEAKENIRTRFSKKEKMENIQPYGAKYEIGEFAYIQYYIFYQIIDWKDENNPSASVVDPMKCIIIPHLPGCKNTATTNNVPQHINIAYYAFYSEIKIKKTSMEADKIMKLKDRFKEEVMKKYFEYQFIKDMINSMPIDFRQVFPGRIEINGEKNINNVINDLNYPTPGGICSEVVGLFEKCFTRNDEKRHFVFLIDGSGSVSSSDFNNMKESIVSMVNYPMNGQNKVSIIEFGSTQQKLCETETVPEIIKKCIYSKSKAGGGTDINGAMDFVVNNYIDPIYSKDRKMRHVVVIFTDGMPNSSVEHKVAELRRKPKTSVTGFGIGDAFNSASALQQLKYITNERYNLDESKYRIKSFSEFEKNRLDLQNTICSA